MMHQLVSIIKSQCRYTQSQPASQPASKTAGHETHCSRRLNIATCTMPRANTDTNTIASAVSWLMQQQQQQQQCCAVRLCPHRAAAERCLKIEHRRPMPARSQHGRRALQHLHRHGNLPCRHPVVTALQRLRAESNRTGEHCACGSETRCMFLLRSCRMFDTDSTLSYSCPQHASVKSRALRRYVWQKNSCVVL
jgi:hypothetical protein